MSNKRLLYAELAHLAKALSSGVRLELLDLLLQAERTVEELATLTGLNFANVSQHLQVLREAQMVEVRRDGLFAYYRACDNGIFSVWETLRLFGEANVASVQKTLARLLKTHADLEAVSADNLARHLEDHSAVLIDVRPAEEYAAAHLPGALSIPLPELKNALSGLPKNKTIVAYCRGPYCLQSASAVQLLRSCGYDARRLEIGPPEWRALGRPLETTATAPRQKHMRRKSPRTKTSPRS